MDGLNGFNSRFLLNSLTCDCVVIIPAKMLNYLPVGYPVDTFLLLLNFVVLFTHSFLKLPILLGSVTPGLLVQAAPS